MAHGCAARHGATGVGSAPRACRAPLPLSHLLKERLDVSFESVARLRHEREEWGAAAAAPRRLQSSLQGGSLAGQPETVVRDSYYVNPL